MNRAVQVKHHVREEFYNFKTNKIKERSANQNSNTHKNRFFTKTWEPSYFRDNQKRSQGAGFTKQEVMIVKWHNKTEIKQLNNLMLHM